MAVGVASPSAQGHAMTRTDINIVSEKSIVSPPKKYHAKPDNTANVITVGTKYPAMMSASFAIGALEPWASSTSLII